MPIFPRLAARAAESRRILLVLAWMVGACSSQAFATLPEVTNLSFQSTQSFSWSALPGSSGYHVYRGTVAGLPSGNYGVCLAGSLQAVSGSDAGTPPLGVAFTYLLAGFDDSGQGSLGTSTAGGSRLPSIPCVAARRFLPMSVNGDPGDGVTDGLAPRRNPSLYSWSSSREFSGVDLHSGEFVLSTVDLWLPGREAVVFAPDPEAGGIHFGDGRRGARPPLGGPTLLARGALRPARSYRSQTDYRGPLGAGWDFEGNARLAPSGSDVLYFDGTGHRELFVRIDASRFTSPAGQYSVLRQNPDGSFTLRQPDGTRSSFHAFDGTNRQGSLESVEDRNQNRVTLLYDHQGLLTTIVDPLGRTVSYGYNAQGRIQSSSDFAGRSVVYTYDAAGDLVSVRSPLVTGTPNGNDFPSGKTTRYTYSSGFLDERLNHNLLSIIPPRESGGSLPAVQNTFGTNPALFSLDRVVAQVIGGTNASGVPAGGSLAYSYLSLNPSADPANPAIARRKATVIDRNGNLREYVHNHAGNLIGFTELTNRNLRPGEPDYTTAITCNPDGEIVQIDHPQGNRTLMTYDRPGADRYREGNLLELRLQADALGSGGRGDGHGAESPDRAWTLVYEPIFNQSLTSREARGNDPTFIPQNGGPWSPDRYLTSWSYDYQEGDPASNGILAYASTYGIVLGSLPFNLGDLNGDGSTSQAQGNAVRIQDPAVLLASGSNQAGIEGDTSQEIAALVRFNAHGQVTAIIDAEGNRHDYEYYPQTDPDGDGSPTPAPPDGRILDGLTGGLLKTRTLDAASAPGRDNGTNPAPTLIRHDFAYDPIGNLTGFVDGRGILTRWVVNSLHQVVELRRAAATADASGPSGDPATGRGETGLTPFAFLSRFAYDADDNLESFQIEDRGNTRGLGPFITTSRVYDLLGEVVEIQRQAASGTNLVTQLRYDANGNRIRVTRPAGNATEWAYDERDLLLSRTRGAFGPRGGTPSTESYAVDPNGGLHQAVDGRGGVVDYLRDGFDRLVRTIDQTGNTSEWFYDPVDNLVRLLRRGPVGGPTPPDRLGSANVDLSDERLLYDEMSRPFRVDTLLYVPVGALPARPPVLVEGPLVPMDGAVNLGVEYDRLSRRSFVLRDSAATNRLDYDGAGRILKVTAPGSNLTEWTYDGDHNIVEIAETEVSSSPGPPPEQFLTTRFYDAANRMTMAVDSLGQTSRRLYDSLDAATTATDARGPMGGSINRRSAGHTGITVPINLHGNVTRHTYDGADRLLSSVRVLTASGQGDGSTTPPPDTTNPSNPDGLITLLRAWDANSLVEQELDDLGNVTAYAYDNLDRLKSLTADDGTVDQRGFDASDNLVSRIEPNGTVITSTYDPANRRVAAAITPAAGIEGTTLRTFEYDGLSRMTKGTDNNVAADATDDVTVRFLYDSLGRVFEEGQQISDGTPSRTSDLRWLADSLATDLIYPSGRQIHYAYDAADRLVSIGDTARPEGVSYQYFGLHRIHTLTASSGLRTTHLDNAGLVDVGFDGGRRTTLLRHLDASSNLLAGFEYLYDRADNPASHRRLHHPDMSGNFKGERYTYDSADRLTLFSEGFLNPSHLPASPSSDSQSWVLDGAGSWPQFNRFGTGFRSTPNNNNEYDEMQSGGTRVDDGVPDDFFDFASTPMPDGFNLTHDKNGSQTNLGLFNLKYDFENRPVRALRNSDSAQVGRYVYDALGRRVKRTATTMLGGTPVNETRRYYHSPVGLLEERDGTDAIVRQSVFGLDPGALVWQIRGDGTSQYLLHDRLGSVVALAPQTTPLIVLERVTYDAYGKPTFESAANAPIVFPPSGPFTPFSPNGNPDLFAGMRYDPELGARTTSLDSDLGGLYQTPFRPLDPNKGRFLTRDPLGVWGDGGSWGNGYAYSGGNPVHYRDASGLSFDAFDEIGDVEGEERDRHYADPALYPGAAAGAESTSQLFELTLGTISTDERAGRLPGKARRQDGSTDVSADFIPESDPSSPPKTPIFSGVEIAFPLPRPRTIAADPVEAPDRLIDWVGLRTGSQRLLSKTADVQGGADPWRFQRFAPVVQATPRLDGSPVDVLDWTLGWLDIPSASSNGVPMASREDDDGGGWDKGSGYRPPRPRPTKLTDGEIR